MLLPKNVRFDKHIFFCFSPGLDGAKWTSDSYANALMISAAEAVTIAHAFNSGDFSSFLEVGVVVDGVKYKFKR